MTSATDTAAALVDAAVLRDEGMGLATHAADPRRVVIVDAAIQAAIDTGRPFSANDIRAKFPEVGTGLVGARMRSFALRRREDGHPLIVCVGRVPSTSKATRCHEIRVWQSWDTAPKTQRVLAGDVW